MKKYNSSKNITRIFACICCIVLLSTTIVSCGFYGDENATLDSSGYTMLLDADTSGTVTVLGNYDNFEALDSAISKFANYYPNISVEYEKLDDYNTNILTRLQNDDSASIFMINRYNFLEAPGLEDIIYDVSDLDINFDDIDKDAYEACYIDGKLFGIPLWYRYYGMVVNEDLLEKEGLSIPENLDELENCLKVLKNAGYTPIQQANSGLPHFFISDFMNIVAHDLTTDEIEALKNGDENAASKVSSCFETMFDMIEKGYISLDNAKTYEDNYNDAILKFFEGDVPFLAASTQIYSGMAKRESKSDAYKENSFTYSFNYIPLSSDGTQLYKTVDTGFALNKNCSNLDIASEFYRFMYTKEILKDFSTIKGIPTTATDKDGTPLGNLPNVDSSLLVVTGDIDDEKDVIQDIYTNVSVQIFSGEITDTDGAITAFKDAISN